jgi:hypothetical protein
MVVCPRITSTAMETTDEMQQHSWFISLFKSPLHLSGDKFANPQEHFF